MSPDEQPPSDHSTDTAPTQSSPTAIPPAHDVRTYVADGVRITAILGIWGVVAAFSTFALGNVGSTGGLLHELGPQLGGLFLVVGLLNALLYLVYRGIDYARV